MVEKGKFIVVEGTDCSGKETQTRLLLERLAQENISAEQMTFPRYDTPTGRIVGKCYLGKDIENYGPGSWFDDPASLDPKIALLYYAADRVAATSEINSILSSGRHLICDRYVESNKGHQAGKISTFDGRKNIVDLIDRLEHELLGIPRADHVIFLFMPYQVGMELKKGRAGMADAHEASSEHLRNAEQCYLELADRFGWERINCAPDGTIGSIKTRESIHAEIYAKINKFLKTKKNE